MLHDLSRTVTGQLRQEDVVEAIEKQVARLIDTRHIFLALVDEATAELVPILRMRDGVRDTQLNRTSIPDRVGLMSIVAASGHTIRTDDYIAECARQGWSPSGRPFRCRTGSACPCSWAPRW